MKVRKKKTYTATELVDMLIEAVRESCDWNGPRGDHLRLKVAERREAVIRAIDVHVVSDEGRQETL